MNIVPHNAAAHRRTFEKTDLHKDFLGKKERNYLANTLIEQFLIKVPNGPCGKIGEYLTGVEVYRLSLINKAAYFGVAEQVRSIFRELFEKKTLFRLDAIDPSKTLSTSQLAIHFVFMNKVNPLILNAFGPLLITSPFLGKFNRKQDIPQHPQYPIVRGILTDRELPVKSEPFISFNIGRRDGQPFAGDARPKYVRFIYVKRAFEAQMGCINAQEISTLIPEDHPNRREEDLSYNLVNAFPMRRSAWKGGTLCYLSEIFCQSPAFSSDMFVPYAERQNSAGTITSEEKKED